MTPGTMGRPRTPIFMTPARQAGSVWARTGLLVMACLASLAQPAAAAIRIEINGVDTILRRNVLALLSLERYKDRDRIEPDAVARLFRRVDGEEIGRAHV